MNVLNHDVILQHDRDWETDHLSDFMDEYVEY